MKNLPRPDQMEYIRMVGNKQDNATLTNPKFIEWLKYVASERIKTTKKISE